jgi:Holliday junction DNA helicase RuvA
MIAFIRGTVADITEDSIILETNGVGYRIFVPGSVQSQAVVGRELKLHTYLSVREDAMNLYGFSSKDDLKVFKLLITVNGIGPKGGLAILSVMSSNDLRYAVMAGDSKAIAKAPGVGSKTAQKIILELKDKLHIEDVFATEDIKPAAGGAGDHTDIINEAVMALAALGYSQTDAMKAVHKCEITDTTTVEELLKLALKKMI